MKPGNRLVRLIAEFLVIVVGVVVALGVDRWVQAMDEAEAEETYLQLVREDLEGNLEVFGRIEADWAAAADASQLLLQALSGERPRPTDTVLLSAVVRAGIVNTQPAREGSFRGMEATGELRLVRDASLRAAIVEYFTQEIRNGRPQLEERTDLRFRTFAREQLPVAAWAELRDLCPWPTPTESCSHPDPSDASRLWRALESEPRIEGMLRVRVTDGNGISFLAQDWLAATERLLARLPVDDAAGPRPAR